MILIEWKSDELEIKRTTENAKKKKKSNKVYFSNKKKKQNKTIKLSQLGELTQKIFGKKKIKIGKNPRSLEGVGVWPKAKGGWTKKTRIRKLFRNDSHIRKCYDSKHIEMNRRWIVCISVLENLFLGDHSNTQAVRGRVALQLLLNSQLVSSDRNNIELDTRQRTLAHYK